MVEVVEGVQSHIMSGEKLGDDTRPHEMKANIGYAHYKETPRFQDATGFLKNRQGIRDVFEDIPQCYYIEKSGVESRLV